MGWTEKWQPTTPQLEHLPEYPFLVVHLIGRAHIDHGVESAADQVRVHVDQPGDDCLAGRIDLPGAGCGRIGFGQNAPYRAGLYEDGLTLERRPTAAVDNACVANDRRACFAET